PAPDARAVTLTVRRGVGQFLIRGSPPPARGNGHPPHARREDFAAHSRRRPRPSHDARDAPPCPVPEHAPPAGRPAAPAQQRRRVDLAGRCIGVNRSLCGPTKLDSLAAAAESRRAAEATRRGYVQPSKVPVDDAQLPAQDFLELSPVALFKLSNARAHCVQRETPKPLWPLINEAMERVAGPATRRWVSG